MTTPDFTELQHLASIIACTIQDTPIHLGSSAGTSDLTAALTLAVARYMGAELGPSPAVIGAIVGERVRQDAHWGAQNHPDGTGPTAEVLGIVSADLAAHEARKICQRNAAADTVTWRDILTEEVCEALAESDPVRLRAELVQVAAVAAAWCEAIDRRTAGPLCTCGHPENQHFGGDFPGCGPCPGPGRPGHCKYFTPA